MAGPTGFEPAISGLTGRRGKPGYTTAPPGIRERSEDALKDGIKTDGRYRTRTSGLLLVRQALSQLS